MSTIILKTLQGTKKINLNDIIYIEHQNRAMFFHLKNKEIIETIKLREPFNNQVKFIIEQGNFVRPHQSYLVNFDYVIGISKNNLVVKNNVFIPISRSRKENTVNLYTSYISKQGYITLGHKPKKEISKEILDNLGVGVSIYMEKKNRKDMVLVFMNKYMCDLHKKTMKEMVEMFIDKSAFCTVHKGDVKRYKDLYKNHTLTTSNFTTRVRLLLDNTYKPFIVNVHTITQKDIIIYYLTYTLDNIIL